MGCPYKWYSLLVYILLQLTRNLGANLEITIVFHRETTTAALMFLSCVHPKQAKKAQSGIVMIYIPISLKEKTHNSNIQIMRFFLKWNWYAIKHDKHVLAIFCMFQMNAALGLPLFEDWCVVIELQTVSKHSPKGSFGSYFAICALSCNGVFINTIPKYTNVQHQWQEP